jgi:hypothetical protein
VGEGVIEEVGVREGVAGAGVALGTGDEVGVTASVAPGLQEDRVNANSANNKAIDFLAIESSGAYVFQ